MAQAKSWEAIFTVARTRRGAAPPPPPRGRGGGGGGGGGVFGGGGGVPPLQPQRHRPHDGRDEEGGEQRDRGHVEPAVAVVLHPAAHLGHQDEAQDDEGGAVDVGV